jgi:hypothetical protein
LKDADARHFMYAVHNECDRFFAKGRSDDATTVM